MRAALVSLVAATFFIGCDQAGPTFITPDPPPGVVPLTVGNWWAMEGERVWPDRGDASPSPQPLGQDTFRVVGDTLIDGERWFELDVPNACHGEWLTYRESDLYSWSEAGGAVLRAPFHPYGPASVYGQYYEVEARRTRLPESGSLSVGGQTFPTVRIELDVERYAGPYDGTPEYVDETVREVDEYIQGVGFAVSECSYARLNDAQDGLTLAFHDRYVLTDYHVAGE